MGATGVLKGMEPKLLPASDREIASRRLDSNWEQAREFAEAISHDLLAGLLTPDQLTVVLLGYRAHAASLAAYGHPSEVERATRSAFTDEHQRKCGDLGSATGESVKYTLTPCSLGTHMTVQCLKCREEVNYTDYETW